MGLDHESPSYIPKIKPSSTWLIFNLTPECGNEDPPRILLDDFLLNVRISLMEPLYQNPKQQLNPHLLPLVWGQLAK